MTTVGSCSYVLSFQYQLSLLPGDYTGIYFSMIWSILQEVSLSVPSSLADILVY